MLEQILKAINNYFYKTGEEGDYNIHRNTIQVKNKYIQGQYIKIEGSILNDGVYKITNISENNISIEGLQDEEFEGRIYGLAIPKAIIEIETKVKEFETNNKNSIYISESFGGAYSYTKATDENGNVQTWKQAFENDLKPYRKISDGKRRVKLC